MHITAYLIVKDNQVHLVSKAEANRAFADDEECYLIRFDPVLSRMGIDPSLHRITFFIPEGLT